MEDEVAELLGLLQESEEVEFMSCGVSPLPEAEAGGHCR
jgi:hypothetical protein